MINSKKFTILFLIATSILFQQCKNKPDGTQPNDGGLSNPQSRIEWEFNRLKDPETGQIPANIRKQELDFAKKLPNDLYQKNTIFNWSARGPWNVGGRTRAMELDVNDENIILAGGVSSGMWRSVDGGQSWIKTTANDQLHNVTCLAQDKRVGKTNTWYFGTGEAYGNSASESYSAFFTGDGIFKSTDNGLTWQSVISTATGSPQLTNNFDLVWNIALDNSNDTADIIYVAVKAKIYRSADNGTTWTPVLQGGVTTSYFTDVAVTTTGVVYATISSEGSKRGIWRSEDGVNYTRIIPSDFPTSYNRIVIAINPSNENELYFLGVTPGFGQQSTNFVGDTEWNSLYKYTYLSGNGADTNGVWVNLSSNIPNNQVSSFDNFYAQGSYDLTLAVKPDEPNVVFIGGTNLYRSTDGFTTPNNVKQIGGYEVGTTFPDFKVYLNHHPDQHRLLFSPSNPDILFNSNDGGVFKTLDCKADTVSWISLNNGYLTSQIYTIAIDENNENDKFIAGFQDNGNFYTNTTNLTSPWTMPLNGDGSFMSISNDGNTFYLSIQNGKVYKMKLDNDGNPTDFARIDPIGGDGYQFINPFELDPNNSNIMYVAAGKYLWRNDSLNYIPLAGNYDSISTGWFKMGAIANYNTVNITSIAISRNPANIVYYGTTAKKVYRIDNANTGDPVHTLLNNTTFFPNGTVSGIAINPDDANKVMIVYSNYSVYSVFYSEDGGTNWIKVAGNLEQNASGSGTGPSCRWASIMPRGDSTYYLLATSVGMFYTTNLVADSTVWTQAGSDVIGNVVCEMIKTRASDGLIAVGTHGNGAFSSHLLPVSIKNTSEMKSDFTIFPNPTKDVLNIQFKSLSINNKLQIFDSTGKLLISLNNITNMQKILLNKLPNGIYYCSLSQNEKSVIKKFIIQK